MTGLTGGGGGGGGGGGALVLLQSAKLVAPAATITFSAYDMSYADLILVLRGDTDATGVTTSDVAASFNGDAGANYPYQSIYAIDSTVAPATNFGLANTFAYLGVIATNDSVVTAAGSLEATIYDYAATRRKTFSSRSQLMSLGSTGPHIGFVNPVGGWQNDAPITDIVLSIAEGANFKAGTFASLYGRAG